MSDGRISTMPVATWPKAGDAIEIERDGGNYQMELVRAAQARLGARFLDVAGSGELGVSILDWSHDFITFRGALTGDRILAVHPDLTGLKLVRNETTGAHDLKLKVAGQQDSGAVTLPQGNSVVQHLYTSLALLTASGGGGGGGGPAAPPTEAVNNQTADFTIATTHIGKWVGVRAGGNNVNISFRDDVGNVGDRIYFACMVWYGRFIGAKWHSGTLKVFYDYGLSTFTSAGTATFASHGTTDGGYFMLSAEKTATLEWTVRQGVWQ